MRWDLTNEKHIEKIKRRIAFSYNKFGGRSEGVEDCAQEVITRMLEGRHKHSTIDQAVIDYLREHCGYKGFRRRTKGQDNPIANSYEQGEFDNFIRDDSIRDVGDRIDTDRLIGMSRHWERCVMTLIFREDYGQVEIGNLFGVSESRVSQWVQRIQGRISTKIKIEESKSQRKRAQELEGVLSQEANGGPRLEQNQIEGLERCESFGLETFNEASF